MTSDLLYEALISVFSCLVGFVIGLGISWKGRLDEDGEPHYTPTLNTSKGMRALFGVIAILALGSVLTTAVVNQRTIENAENQADCNHAFNADVANNTRMVKAVTLLIATPRENRDPGAFAAILDDFLKTAEANDNARDSIPGCETP